MIENGKYGKTVISCEPAHGICHKKQECSTCFYAKKHELNKKVYEIARECNWKDGVNCLRFEKECKAEECKIVLCQVELLN